jgi:glutathione S-transferase
MRRQPEVLDRTTAQTGQVAGADFLLADIDLMPMLYYLRKLPEGGEMLQSNRNLNTCYDASTGRPCFKDDDSPAPSGATAAGLAFP